MPSFKRLGICFLCIIAFQFIYSQDFKYINPPDYLKTIRLFNPQTNNEQPFILLGEYFILSFDELTPSYVNYSYKIKRFDRNWKKDNLFESEYIDGYISGLINNYAYSFNTLVKYMHFEVNIPNEKMRITKSGNYAVYVYGKDKQNPVFVKPFTVIEPLVNIGIRVDRGISTKTNNFQQINVTAFSENFNFNDNYNSLSLSIFQNNHLSLNDIKPQFTKNKSIIFGQLDNMFDGGNEFYSFDTKNLLINGITTERIVQNDPFDTYLYLITPYPEMYDGYFEDVNGEYYIRRNEIGEERSGATDADYTNVYFGLKMDKPLENKDIYVVGRFNDYQLYDNYKMKYNESGFYELPILLKQGYYNYTFVTKDIITGKEDWTELNGSFWETKNSYQAVLYWTPWGQSYDLAIGFGENFSKFY